MRQSSYLGARHPLHVVLQVVATYSCLQCALVRLFQSEPRESRWLNHLSRVGQTTGMPFKYICCYATWNPRGLTDTKELPKLRLDWQKYVQCICLILSWKWQRKNQCSQAILVVAVDPEGELLPISNDILVKRWTTPYFYLWVTPFEPNHYGFTLPLNVFTCGIFQRCSPHMLIR